jgi:hypothetical protein
MMFSLKFLSASIAVTGMRSGKVRLARIVGGFTERLDKPSQG